MDGEALRCSVRIDGRKMQRKREGNNIVKERVGGGYVHPDNRFIGVASSRPRKV
jgi:hypothetical protein